MIAIDASVIIPWTKGDAYPETARLDELLDDLAAVLAPVTVTELLSDQTAHSVVRAKLVNFPVLHLTDGYWERAGLLRANIRKAGRKAALGDALIAQACLDADVPLLTRDGDFGAFAELAGLKLA